MADQVYSLLFVVLQGKMHDPRVRYKCVRFVGSHTMSPVTNIFVVGNADDPGHFYQRSKNGISACLRGACVLQ